MDACVEPVSSEPLAAFTSEIINELLLLESRQAVDARLKAIGVAKLGRRLVVMNALDALRADGPSLESNAASDAEEAPRLHNGDVEDAASADQHGPRPLLELPCGGRIVVVCHTGFFASDQFGGATRANLAMVREIRRACGSAGLDIVALLQRPVPERMVFKLEGGRLGELPWEGERVLVGRDAELLAALRSRMCDARPLPLRRTPLTWPLGEVDVVARRAVRSLALVN